MTEIEDTLKNGTPAEKKDVLYELRSNLTLKEKKLNISNRKSINAFAECILRAKLENKAFEPKNTFPDLIDKDSKEKTEVFASVIPTLLPLLVAFRTLNWTSIKSELQFSDILNLKQLA